MVVPGHTLLHLRYHEKSKHRLQAYAPGPGRLDWANQPNPFREFAGAARVTLSLGGDNLPSRYNDVREGRLPPPHRFDCASVSILLELALGLSAWKAYGTSRWALRCNPSSGNLHPTEGYVVWPGGEGLEAGVYHYVSRDHALERRAGAAPWPQAGGFAIGLTSIHWREAWKYGMRAWRYCQHDSGHAMGAVAYAAAALGWPVRRLAFGDDDIAALLGLDRAGDFADAEAEVPDVLLWIGDPARAPCAAELRERLRSAEWHGVANRLSETHVAWRDIDDVHQATRRPAPPPGAPPDGALGSMRRFAGPPALDLPFATVARRRRSAVDFDGVTGIEADAFHAMLDALMPRRHTPPWNALEEPPAVHPAVLVHRVRGLEPGLYVLVRDAAALPALREAMRPEWLWQPCGPDGLPLYLLLPHDLRDVARTICCHQDIAADSCFALGMLAPVEASRTAPWRYRDHYRECGLLGHALYLEAEAAGVRATGIGCFFDDEMHRLLGLRDAGWQSLYHFTVGGPVEDPRLQTLPPYGPR